VDTEIRGHLRNPGITVIDYGMGNIWSVLSALKYLNCDPVVSSDPIVIANSETLILPGVGSFRKAMNSLRELKLDEAIKDAVVANGKKIIGICLGMQLLGSKSSEDGETMGLNLVNSSVDLFTIDEAQGRKVPHIGFDQVNSVAESILFKGISNMSDFYFVHSYRMLKSDLDGTIASCDYGVSFVAAYEKDNVFATQFHPEKSQTNGLILLQNFISV
jgi:glutamine amidotransferase